MKDSLFDLIQDYYEIFEDGRVYSHHSNKFLKTCFDKDGYERISLQLKNGKRTEFKIHKLVALTYLEKIGDVVNHKDGNKLNNHYTNLEWTTVQYNTQHAYDNGLCTANNPIKMIFPNGKIMNFISESEAARFFEYANPSVINRCARNSHVMTSGRLKDVKIEYDEGVETIETVA